MEVMESSVEDADFYGELMDFRNENVARNPVERVAPPNVEIQTDERSLVGPSLQIDFPVAHDADEGTTAGVVAPPPPPPPPPSPSLTLTALPTSVAANITVRSGDVGVTINKLNGLSGNATLSVTGLPAGTSVRINNSDNVNPLSFGPTSATTVVYSFLCSDNSKAGTYGVTFTATVSGVSASVSISVTFIAVGGGGGGVTPSSAGLSLNVNLSAVNSINWNPLDHTYLNGVTTSVTGGSGVYPGPFQLSVSIPYLKGTAGAPGAGGSATANSVKLGEAVSGYLDFGVGHGSADITVVFKALVVGFKDFDPPLTRSFLFHMH
jgi:hypothetical protein